MWSVGVIAYVLYVTHTYHNGYFAIFRLSGISPFLGENNAHTYNNVTRGEWSFDEEAFEEISQLARDFISKLIVYDKR
jgi:myosin-light-chain kinase